MKVCVFTSNGWESAEYLANMLRVDIVRSSILTHKYDLIIRYGNRSMVSRGKVVLNDIEAVEKCVDRVKFAETMSRHGIRNPYIFGKWKKLKWGRRYPRYLYGKDGSQQSNGIVIVQSEEDKKWLEKLGWEWSIESVWVKTKNEWRVHAIDIGEGKYVSLVQKKEPTKIDLAMFMVRNVARTKYRFRVVDECPKEIRNIGIMAVKACGLDFGAVDVIEDMKGRVWVVDVNSAPGIVRVRRVGKFYVENLKKRLEYECGRW